MAPKVFDPLVAQEALQDAREAREEDGAAVVARAKPKPAKRPKKPRKAASAVDLDKPAEGYASQAPAPPPKATPKTDFRLFLILLWRHLLGCDPNPAQLDLAWFLQHGPDRSVILAFRGFSKSWITGAYALWRLYVDPQEKILVVSGSLTRAVATTNWCLMLIQAWPLLAHLIPSQNQRQSSKAFDVGPATPSQSPSFHALGIGGQIVGFRGTCIIPDDVETQQNSLTVTMREKIAEAVKEFDSVLTPGGVIKFLGTPHDEDSLYSKLPKRGYTVAVWPAQYPTKDEIKTYGDRLAPWVTQQLRKDPGLVGRTIMPSRFTDDDLAKRRLSLGTSEYSLQFMLDMSLSNRDKYPLKVKDLMVMSVDPRRGPEAVTWSEDPRNRIADLPLLGFEGDHYHQAIVDTDVRFAPWTRVVGFVDNSGRGSDETALTVLAELHGVIYLIHLWASRAGYGPETLLAIAERCVRFKINKLRVEANFGDGMFAALLRPVLEEAWRKANAKQPRGSDPGGTEIEEVRSSNQMNKEKRILSILEPVTQQHRLVVCRSVVEWDFKSLQEIEGEDTRHRYSLFHQMTHLTRERESLLHDDRLDSLAGGIADFADILGVDPSGMAVVASQEREEEEWAKLFGGDMDEDELGVPRGKPGGGRAVGFKPQAR